MGRYNMPTAHHNNNQSIIIYVSHFLRTHGQQHVGSMVGSLPAGRVYSMRKSVINNNNRGWMWECYHHLSPNRENVSRDDNRRVTVKCDRGGTLELLHYQRTVFVFRFFFFFVDDSCFDCNEKF